MSSNIRSHQHLIGPVIMAGNPCWNIGTDAENGAPLPEIFHFNHCPACVKVIWYVAAAIRHFTLSTAAIGK